MTRLGLIGPGRVGRSLVQALPRERYLLGPVLGKGPSTSRRLVRDLRTGRATTSIKNFEECNLILVATPDSAMPEVASALEGGEFRWKGKCVLHTCRRPAADLDRLSKLGAAVGGCCPLQSFQRSQGSLQGVHFVLDGDAAAVRAGRAAVRAMGGLSHVFDSGKKLQAATASTIVSDAVSAVIEAGVRQLVAAGFSRRRGVEAISPIVTAMLEDYRRSGGRSSQVSAAESELFAQLASAGEPVDASEHVLHRRALQAVLAVLEVEDANNAVMASVERDAPDRPSSGG